MASPSNAAPPTQLWPSFTIIRMSQDGENDFAEDYPCILTRISLTITAKQAVYTLPDNVRSIRRITWKSFKLDPLGQRNMREVFQYASQVGKPYWYVFNNIGQNNVQFFPIPDQSVTPSNTDLWGQAVTTDVIVEYWILPDFANYTIPNYFRRRLLKNYVMKSCFGIEGPGQNLKNRDYFNQRWEMMKKNYGEFLDEIHNKSRKLCLNGITSSQFFPGQPVLPVSRFGIGIDDGY
jgi:hypothetical protein